MLSEILFLFFEIVNDISQFVDGLGRNLEKLQIFWIRLKIARKLFLSDSRSEIRVCVYQFYFVIDALWEVLLKNFDEDLQVGIRKIFHLPRKNSLRYTVMCTCT